MEALVQDLGTLLGMLGSLYATALLLRRIALGRSVWLGREADDLVTTRVCERYAEVLDEFAVQSLAAPYLPAEPHRVSIVDDGPDPDSPCWFLSADERARSEGGCGHGAGDDPVGVGAAAGPVLGDEAIRVLHHQLNRFARFSAMRILPDASRDELLARAADDLRRRAVGWWWCPRGEARRCVAAAYRRLELKLAARLSEEFHRFCVIARNIQESTGAAASASPRPTREQKENDATRARRRGSVAAAVDAERCTPR